MIPNWKLREFVEDDVGRGSAARLNMIIGVLVGSFTVIWLTVDGGIGWEIFAAYLGATGGIYGFGKWRESVVETEQIKADSPNQPPPAPPQPAPLVTNINVGDTKSDKPKEGQQ